MLSIEQTRKLLNDPKISEEEVKEIRDSFRMLAEIIFEKWQQEKQAKTSQKLYPQKYTSLEKQISI
ncbi:MAG: hypothetical protein ACE5J0_01695 [Candidatus Paceibacterales bacterium]